MLKQKINPLEFVVYSDCQTGQTLIETIIALFVLTTGISAGLALAIFVFAGSSDLTEKVVATGLAREGIEAVRRHRDSNWLSGTLSDCGGGQQCYANWLTGVIGSSGGVDYRMNFNLTTTNSAKWSFQAASGSPSATFYRLYRQAGGGLSHTVTSNPTNLFRKVTIIYTQTTPPYNSTSPLVTIRSSVWWHERSCPTITNLTSPSQTPCKIITEENITNWKNY